MNFVVFQQAVAKQFEQMQKHPLYRVDVTKDALWETYLGSYPEGTNPIFRERTEHDCNCCKQFIRAVGNVVAIVDGKLVSIWDINVADKEPVYQVVAEKLAALVKGAKIANTFLHFESTAGKAKTFEELTNGQHQWNHFFVNIPRANVMAGKDIPSALNEPRTNKETLLRALNEISLESLDTVQELIAQNSIYKGEEVKFVVDSLAKLKRQFNKLKTEQEKEIFAWVSSKSHHISVCRIKNSPIGVLMTDLTEGFELEDVVKAYEAMVAPANYKRSTALVTPKMVELAKAKIQELGLTSALQRRFANMSDITINNVLWANRSTRNVIGGDVFDDLIAAAPAKVKSLDKVEKVTIAKFLEDILPKADSIEIMFENRHQNNLVSLIAPSDPTAGNLFKWDNKMSWSYAGEFADAIKERVKKAGGNVTGDLCCRLSWSNHDDLDLHLEQPGGLYEISFRNRRCNNTEGQLDVDMNAGRGTTREPVENIFFPSKAKMREGKYRLFVNQFSKRETSNVGFQAQIDFLGTVYSFSYDQAVRQNDNVVVAEFEYTHKNGLKILGGLPNSQSSQSLWGLSTQTFVPVNAIMMSPNYWDGNAVGNRHFMFMLEGALNDDSARPFFNEFLKEELNPHRKVFEVVAGKMRVADAPDQLSGLGFSSTVRNSLLCRVKGSFTRTIEIEF